MPVDPARYPKEWSVFSHRIREGRAQGRCECWGQCGLHLTHPGPRQCEEMNHTAARWAKGRVVLTVAHLCDCDPACVIEGHVIAACNRCHLRIDVTLHRRHAAETRRLQLNNLELFDKEG